ncbi:MAG TPA: TonB-dependent receptor [Candidatus Competibacteraceae bacterium]|nr:TonB-dependent receptor [Candidatus Competibacteraceae bacterium]MCP5132533.1 TonB-dependent receptor [Gammaproteobacteria bacterium]HPF59060.1 TonB-dependent receptor [Candidatus Competibacteraceae bacterium]HRY19457.1 TonB-dependent receptor [Candidatus Competibacteraceae bacterium]
MKKQAFGRIAKGMLALVAGVGLASQPGRVQAAEVPDLTYFSIEELMQIKVVSATKVEQALQDIASAVFVITADDIRRSGVTNVMEALRLAPGVEVARVDSSRWAITIRGFNGRFANKLLVLIDGRSIYTSQFSGVYWELQDLFLPDIERIEVIRGPGGSLWGANAVNGVINIITKNSEDTQGGLVTLTAGNEERAIAGVRYGGKLGDSTQYRVYGQFSERDGLATLNGRDAGDDWRMSKGGFRLDWAPSAQDKIAVQGDRYEGNFDQNYVFSTLVPVIPAVNSEFSKKELVKVNATGGSLQAHWEHQYSAASQIGLQVYYQYADREEPLYIADTDTFDIDFQHNFTLGDRQNIVWGLGYRRNWDQFTDTVLATVNPRSATTELFNAFVQDQVDLIPEQLRLTAGVKLEHNDFTGWEWQPSIRMLWTPRPNHHLWAAISRAIRTPSRGEENAQTSLYALPPSPVTGNLPTLIALLGNNQLDAEKLIAYEAGYRVQLAGQFSIDTTVFYNDYDQVVGTVLGTPFLETGIVPPYLVLPLQLENAQSGYDTGFELAADWRPMPAWRMQLAYSYLHSNIKRLDDPTDYSFNLNQISVLSSWNLSNDLELDAWGRYVNRDGSILTLSPFNRVKIDPYFSLNLRLGWRPRKDLEFSLAGTNLLDGGGGHLEYVQEAYTFPVEVQRSLYGQMKWSF